MVERLVAGGISCALVLGLLVLWRSQKPESKWLFLMGLLEGCADDSYGEGERLDVVGSTEAGTGPNAPKTEAIRDN